MGVRPLARRARGTAIALATLAALLRVTLPVSAALAQEVPQGASPGPAALPADGEKVRAQALLEQGFHALDEGDMPLALARFRDAYSAFPRASLLLNIGNTLRQMGRNAEAAGVYRRYLADGGAAEARREQVERILREISLVVGRLRILVSAPGAVVLVGGQELAGPGPHVVELDPGRQTVVATTRGKPKAAETVELQAGREIAIRLDVTGDDRPVFHLVKRGLPPAQVAGVVLLGIGAAGLAVGAGFGGAAVADNGGVAQHCSRDLSRCEPAAETLVESATFKARVSTVALALGASSALIGGVLAILGRDQGAAGSDSQGSPVVAFANGGVVAGWTGTW